MLRRLRRRAAERRNGWSIDETFTGCELAHGDKRMGTTAAEPLDWIADTFEELPVAKLLGARPVACDPVAGCLTVQFAARPEFCNLLGWIQGGMLKRST
jgi:hypothetical protein